MFTFMEFKMVLKRNLVKILIQKTVQLYKRNVLKINFLVTVSPQKILTLFHR